MNKALKYSMFVTFFSTLLLIFLAIWRLSIWQEEETQLDHELVFKVNKGMSLKEMSEALQEKGLIHEPILFKTWVRLNRLYPKIQAGNYFFEETISPKSILKKFMNGEVYRTKSLEFTVPEGFTLHQINERLAELKLDSFNNLQKLTKNKKFLNNFKVGLQSLEGFLYPATYIFYDEFPEPGQVYEKMWNEFHNRIPRDYLKKCKEKKLTLEEAVTFASLIEKETLNEAEKPMVSEVIWNRLTKKMTLGIDAAIIYGIENYDGNITFKHLKDRSNPYNLRLRTGLPPGPIGSPSLTSLEAVFTPSDNGFYYYVLLAGDKKIHHFSKTLKEHNKYVRKLVKSQKNLK